MKERSKSKAELKGTFGLARVFDGFFLLRPTLIFPLWTMVLAGYKISGSHEAIGLARWTMLAVALTSLFGLVYLLNQMRDREGDKRNEKSALIANEMVSRRVQVGVGIFLGIMAPLFLVLSGFGHLGLWMVATFGVAGLLYNYTPIALERTPFGGIISGAIGAWLLLRLGEYIAGNEVALLRELPYILAFSAGCLLTSLPDLQGDSETGKNTFAVAFGERATTLLALIMVAVTGIIGAVGRDWIIVVPAIGGVFALFIALIKKNYRLAVGGNKLSIFILTIGLGLVYPIFLSSILLYFPLARWYHRKRFGLIYPNFHAEYAGESTQSLMNSK